MGRFQQVIGYRAGCKAQEGEASRGKGWGGFDRSLSLERAVGHEANTWKGPPQPDAGVHAG